MTNRWKLASLGLSRVSRVAGVKMELFVSREAVFQLVITLVQELLEESSLQTVWVGSNVY